MTEAVWLGFGARPDPWYAWPVSSYVAAYDEEQMRLGRVEKAILDVLEDDHQQTLRQVVERCHVRLAEPGDELRPPSRSLYESCHRAAHRLAEKGLIVMGFAPSDHGPSNTWLHRCRQGRRRPDWRPSQSDGL